MRRTLALTLVVLAFVAADAAAQTDTIFGLGLAVTTDDPTGKLGLSATSIGPVIRLNLGPGVGPALGFDWYAVGVEATAGGRSVFVGNVSVHPVMGGVSYNWQHGRYWIAASVVGGYAFNKFTDVDSGAASTLGARLGATGVSFKANNSFVWRPQLGFWWDAGPRVGVNTSIAYIGLRRPTMTIGTAQGTYEAPLQVSSVVLTFCLVYGIF